jgi:N-acyl-D-aspartate/D-glutamate deacylase
MSEFDVLIENAHVVEESGKAPYKGSVGVKGGKITPPGKIVKRSC